MKVFTEVHPAIVLSQLWIFILFSIFFADFQWLINASALEEIASGVIRGNEVTPELLVFASIVHLIPVVMVTLSRLTVRSVNRWLNLIAGVLVLLMTIGAGGWDVADQAILRVAQIIALLLIVWNAWTWKKDMVATG